MEKTLSSKVRQHLTSKKRHYGHLRFKLEPGDEVYLHFLPEDRRALLMADGSYRELAERFCIPIGTVRSRLHRARAVISDLRSQGDDVAVRKTPTQLEPEHLSAGECLL